MQVPLVSLTHTASYCYRTAVALRLQRWMLRPRETEILVWPRVFALRFLNFASMVFGSGNQIQITLDPGPVPSSK